MTAPGSRFKPHPGASNKRSDERGTERRVRLRRRTRKGDIRRPRSQKVLYPLIIGNIPQIIIWILNIIYGIFPNSRILDFLG